MNDMDFADEEIRRAAEIRQWVDGRILELDREIEHLKGVVVFLDAVLRKGSFQPATDLQKPSMQQEAELLKPTSKSATNEYQEIHPLKRSRDGLLMANAYISESSIAIVPTSDIILKTSTPPFSSFFLNRILEDMKRKDNDNVAANKLDSSDVLNYMVEADKEGIIKKIVVNNYRDQNRLNEIFNTSAWTFARMLEKDL